MTNCEGKVGAFFFLGNSVVSDSIVCQKADSYGVWKNWSSHDSFWAELGKTDKAYKNSEYFIYPRGRVAYNTEKNLFYIYLNPILNNPEIVNKVIREFSLTGCEYLIDDTDVHYKFYTSEEINDLLEE